MEPNINTPKRLLLPFLGILLRPFRLKKHPVNLGGLLAVKAVPPSKDIRFYLSLHEQIWCLISPRYKLRFLV